MRSKVAKPSFVRVFRLFYIFDLRIFLSFFLCVAIAIELTGPGLKVKLTKKYDELKEIPSN